MTEDAARIAKGLTEAQRQALVGAYCEQGLVMTRLETFRSGRALHRMGLTNLRWSPSGLTPLGLAVRAALADKGARAARKRAAQHR